MADVIAVSPVDVCELWLSRAFSALEACGAEPIDTAYVAAGAIAWDTCCGLLVVAPERTYRSAQFPIEGTTDYVCESAFLVVDVVILLLRCVPTLDDRGNPPPVPKLSAAYGSVLNDAAILWNVAAGELPEGWQRANVDQTYVGAQGGCVGVETRMSIGLAQSLWCPTCESVDPGPEPNPYHVTFMFQNKRVEARYTSLATRETVIDWGDGQTESNPNSTGLGMNFTHEYDTVGEYLIRIFDDDVQMGDWPILLPALTSRQAIAGSPGEWTPSFYTVVPTEYEMTTNNTDHIQTVWAEPQTPWLPGQHVITEDGKPVYWTGAQLPGLNIWKSGVAP